MNNAMMQALMGAMRNPAQILNTMGLGQDALNNPQQAVQSLMNSGKMNQQQFEQLRQTATQIMNNPMFQGMLKK